MYIHAILIFFTLVYLLRASISKKYYTVDEGLSETVDYINGYAVVPIDQIWLWCSEAMGAQACAQQELHKVKAMKYIEMKAIRQYAKQLNRQEPMKKPYEETEDPVPNYVCQNRVKQHERIFGFICF
jgi:hypothetical protein